MTYLLGRLGRNASGGGARRWWVGPAVLAAVLAAASLPWLSGGVDIYAHLLWTHQTMRCLAAGELPLWAPDMNGGFGSPGIRLYSPAGPVAAGILGLLLGSAGAGLRAVLVLAAAGLLLLTRRGRGGAAAGVILLAGTPFLADLLVRAAWSQMVALPVAWWLLEGSVEGSRLMRRPVRAGVATACLWLIHAPSALMTAALVALAALLRLGVRAVPWGLRWALTAAALTAWHWMPLAVEMRLTSARQGLTTGIFDAARNWLGASSAHMPALNAALSAAAVAMALVTLVLLYRRTDSEPWVRGILVVVSLAFSTALVVPLVRLGLPLGWLQFPWRWLTPAAILLAAPLAASWRRRPVLLALWLAPALALPRVAPVAPPALTAEDGWPEVGAVVASFGGNPLAVDVIEHRPPWYPRLAEELRRFGPRARVVTGPGARAAILRWLPLERELEVTAATPAEVRLRLLRYPGWRIRVDGREAAPLTDGAAVAIPVGPGRHRVVVAWRGNPYSRLGLAVAALGLLAVAPARRIRRRSGPPGVGT